MSQEIFKLNDQKIYMIEDKNTTLVFSTNQGGISVGPYKGLNLALHVGDNPDTVIENRKIYAQKLQLDLKNFIFTNQTHSANFKEVFKHDMSSGIYTTNDAIPNTDCIYSFDDVVLNCFYADCTPIYFYAQKHNLIGIIHAGWKSTIQEISYKVFFNIIHNHQIPPQDITIVIGPTIQMNNFEVQQDLIQQINNKDQDVITTINNKTYLDNVKLNIKQIKRLEITNIKVSKIDTYLDDKLYSYRKKNITGRMCATIYQTNNIEK